MQEVAVGHNANNNVELGGRNTFKFFLFGIQKKKFTKNGAWMVDGT